jgi:hypothetical protein
LTKTASEKNATNAIEAMRVFLALLIFALAEVANSFPPWTIGGSDPMSSYALAFAVSQTPGVDASQNATAVALFPVRQNGKYGYIDRAGKIAIKPQFNRAARFSDGLALVQVGGDHAYIEPAGNVVIKLNYREFNLAFDFSEGMAVVGKRGPGDFIQDILGYINKTGTLVIPLQFDHAREFSEELAVVSLRYKRGYIDTTGKFVIEPQFGVAENFSDGLARVGSYVQGLPQEHYIDRTGKRAIRQKFRFIDDFSEGLAAAWVGDQKGYIDRSGALVIKPQPFNSVSRFSDGMARVQMGGPMGKGGRLGFIDRTGKTVIKPQYEFAQDFSEGLCAVLIGEKYGYIDRTGAVAIQPQFRIAEPFWQGLAGVWVGDRVGYINKTGKYIWHPT